MKDVGAPLAPWKGWARLNEFLETFLVLTTLQ